MEESGDLEKLRAELEVAFAGRLHVSEPMARHTNFCIGGPADLLIVAENVDELCRAFLLARKHKVPCFILGVGSNILVSDAGLRGLVIKNHCRKYTLPEPMPGGRDTAQVEAGVLLSHLARRTVSLGLAGLEWAVGIPGTLGGAIINNSGAYGKAMEDVIQQVELLEGGKRVEWPAEQLEYGYRDSALKRRLSSGNRDFVVLSATMIMSTREQLELAAIAAAYGLQRRQTQPGGATIGSMFKNPPGDFAGRLIDAAGLKGEQIGGGQISPLHANFFLNVGQATAADIMGLIELTRDTVRKDFGVELELEIELWGEH